MFLFWIITWAVSFLLFLLIPLCCVPENRRRLYFRVTLMKWNVDAEMAQAAQGNNPTGVTTGAVGASAAADADHDSNFHYVLSRAQEDEIRESFLAKKLQKYTFTLSPSSIQRLRSDTLATATSSTSVDSGGDGSGGAAPHDSSSSSSSPYGDDNEADLEEAAASIFQPPPNTDVDDDAVHKATTATEDCCSSDDGLSDDGLMLEMDEFFDDSSMVILPNLSSGGGGKSGGGNKNSTSPVRQVPNGCAICLTTMDAGDRVTFSSDPKCNHIFHEECMKDWLVASGRKFLKRQRREARNHSSSESGAVYRYNCHNPVETILSFPMLCPCCRQPFVNKVEEEDSDDDDSLAKPSTTNAAGVVTDPGQPAGTDDVGAEPVADIEAPNVHIEESPPMSTAEDDEAPIPTTTSVAIAVGSGGE